MEEFPKELLATNPLVWLRQQRGLAQLFMEKGEAKLEWKVEGKGEDRSHEGYPKKNGKKDSVKNCVSNTESDRAQTMFAPCGGCN